MTEKKSGGGEGGGGAHYEKALLTQACNAMYHREVKL